MEQKRTKTFHIVRVSVESLWSELHGTLWTAQRRQEAYAGGAHLEVFGEPSGRGVHSMPIQRDPDQLQWNAIKAAALYNRRLLLGTKDARTWTRTRTLRTMFCRNYEGTWNQWGPSIRKLVSCLRRLSFQSQQRTRLRV